MKTRNKKQTVKTKQTDKDRAYPDLMIRNASVEVRAGEGDNAAQVIMSVSSEEPVLSYINFNDSWMRAYEILDHSDGSVDMSRVKDGLVILDRHYGDQVGLMAVSLDAKKLGGPVTFGTGTRSQEIGNDASAGVRRNVSVGYQVDTESYRIEGDQDGVPVVRAMSWTPYEASFEPVPADTTVGVNRSHKPVEPEKPEPTKEVQTMDPKEMARLFALAARHEIDATKVQDLIADGKGENEIRALIVDKQDAELEATRKEVIELKERKPDAPVDTPNVVPPIGGSVDEEARVAKRYSVMSVVRSLAGMGGDIGYEREVSQECAKLRGKPADGIIIPYAALAMRDFTVSGTSSASVATDLHSQEFIELLRSSYAIGELGVQFLTGLVGEVAIPKMSAGATGYWVSEGNAVTESEPTLTQVTGTPHTAGALVDISRKLMIQSTPDAETMVRNEIIQRVLRTVQSAVFDGSGAAGEPSAITNASGINNSSVTTGTPTHAEILGFVSDIMSDNAVGTSQKWAMTAEVWAKLADTDIDSGSGRKVLDYRSKTMVGYPYVDPCSDLPDNSLWFGDWSSVVVGIWGNGVDVAATDAKLFSSGGMTLRALQDVDVMVRLGQALAYNTTVTS